MHLYCHILFFLIMTAFDPYPACIENPRYKKYMCTFLTAKLYSLRTICFMGRSRPRHTQLLHKSPRSTVGLDLWGDKSPVRFIICIFFRSFCYGSLVYGMVTEVHIFSRDFTKRARSPRLNDRSQWGFDTPILLSPPTITKVQMRRSHLLLTEFCFEETYNHGAESSPVLGVDSTGDGGHHDHGFSATSLLSTHITLANEAAARLPFVFLFFSVIVEPTRDWFPSAAGLISFKSAQHYNITKCFP